MLRSPQSRRRAAAALAAVCVGAGVVVASDHQDTPEVELNPQMDMTDVYVFPGSAPDRIVLVMNSSPFLTPAQTPGATFDHNLLYQFKIDNNGDAIEDRVIQVTFDDSDDDQRVEVRGPVAPPFAGAMQNEVADADAAVSGSLNENLGSADDMQVFAGARDDPFFLDLEQFFRILPDRKPAGGELSQLPDEPTATSFRPAGAAVNYITGYNVLSIVVELPIARLTEGGGPRLGIWGTISR